MAIADFDHRKYDDQPEDPDGNANESCPPWSVSLSTCRTPRDDCATYEHSHHQRQWSELSSAVGSL
jgi:hypothetical protein